MSIKEREMTEKKKKVDVRNSLFFQHFVTTQLKTLYLNDTTCH